MGIYIKGMRMPQENELIEVRIYPNGRVSMVHDMKCEQIATAIEVPGPHGRLIDVDKLIIKDYTYCEAPTVIESEVEE